MKPEVTRWFDRTQQDQMVAAHLLENFRPIPIEIICTASRLTLGSDDTHPSPGAFLLPLKPNPTAKEYSLAGLA